jgi:hypothetical protein
MDRTILNNCVENIRIETGLFFKKKEVVQLLPVTGCDCHVFCKAAHLSISEKVMHSISIF